MRAGRNNYINLTDPVTTNKAVAQFELLQRILDEGYITDENFYIKAGDSSYMCSRAQRISDCPNSSKLFEGQWLHEGGEAENLDDEFINLLQLLEEPEYTIRSADFRVSASKDSYASESSRKKVSDWEEFSGNMKETFSNMYGGTGYNSGEDVFSRRNYGGTLANYGSGLALSFGAPALVGTGSAIVDTFNGRQQAKEDAKFEKEMEGGHVIDSKIITVDIPKGYIYDDFSVYGSITCNKTRYECFPYVGILSRDDDVMNFIVELFVSSKFISDEYYLFDGKFEVLFKRKV